jgi:hypothetical protein
MKYVIVRAVLEVAATRDLKIRQSDVTVVFLGENLLSDHDVYML